MTTAEISLGLLVTLNAGALVWGAATLSASVRQLGQTVTRLDGFLEKVDERVDDHETRISVMEDRRGR